MHYLYAWLVSLPTTFEVLYPECLEAEVSFPFCSVICLSSLVCLNSHPFVYVFHPSHEVLSFVNSLFCSQEVDSFPKLALQLESTILPFLS